MDFMNPGDSWSYDSRLSGQARGAAGFPDSGVMGSTTRPMPDTPEPEPAPERTVTLEEALRTLVDGPLSPIAMLQKLGIRADSRNIGILAEWLRAHVEAQGDIESVGYKLTQQGASYLREPEPAFEPRRVTREEVLRTLLDGPLWASAMLQKLGFPADSQHIASFTAWLAAQPEARGYIESGPFKLTKKGLDYCRRHPESR